MRQRDVDRILDEFSRLHVRLDVIHTRLDTIVEDLAGMKVDLATHHHDGDD